MNEAAGMSDAGASNRGSSSRRKIEGIEVLRFLLAFGVMIYHYAYFGPLSGKVAGVAPGPDWLVAGRFGVSAFFIISGFVIIYSAGERGAMAFARARLARLMPAMLICSTVSAAVLAIIPGTLPAPSLGVWAKAASTLGLLLGGPYVDGSYWSITIELRFYLYVFFMLLFLRNTRRIQALTVVWLVLSFAAMANYDFTALRLLTLSPHSGYFIVGIILYCWMILDDCRFALWAMGPGLVLAAWQSWVEFSHIAEMGGGQSTVWTGVGAAVLSLLLVRIMTFGIDNSALAAKARVVGAMSYPLYLFHQALGYRVIERLVAMGVSAYASIAASVFLVCAAAWCLTVWIEPAGRALIMRVPLPATFWRKMPGSSL